MRSVRASNGCRPVSEDARFEDAGGAPLRLRAFDTDDLQVISALVQDAVLPASEMRWSRKDRRFALLLNRFRWEESAAPKQAERVQSVLSIEDVTAVKVQGLSQHDPDLVVSILTISFEPSTDGAGRVLLTLAGDGAIACEVEALEVMMRDVTRPYGAPSGKTPAHLD